MILGATVQKLWVFEVFGQGLAMVGMYWSQPTRVDHLHKKWRAREKKIQKKMDRLALSRCQPAAGRQPAVARRPRVDTWIGPVCSNFLFFKTFFEACPCKILHFPWRLEISPFLKCFFS
jgi:hypothetical protein